MADTIQGQAVLPAFLKVETRTATPDELANMVPPIRYAYEQGQVVMLLPDGIAKLTHNSMKVDQGVFLFNGRKK